MWVLDQACATGQDTEVHIEIGWLNKLGKFRVSKRVHFETAL